MTFKSWTKILPLFVLERLARQFAPGGTAKINGRDWFVFRLNKDSALVVEKEKYRQYENRARERRERREEKRREKALQKFMKIRRDYPEVVAPYLKKEEGDDDSW